MADIASGGSSVPSAPARSDYGNPYDIDDDGSYGYRREPEVDKLKVGLGAATILGGGAAAWGVHAVKEGATAATAALPQLQQASKAADLLTSRAGTAADAVREAQRLLGSHAITAWATEGTSVAANIAKVSDVAYPSAAEALARSIDFSGKGSSGVFSLGGHHVPVAFDAALRDFTYTAFRQQPIYNGKTTTFITVPYTASAQFTEAMSHANVSAVANGEGAVMRRLGSFEGVALANAEHTIASAPWKKPLLGVLAAVAVIGGAYLVWKGLHPDD